jgi:hypothetical protein
VAQVRERIAVNEQRSQRFNMESFNLKKLQEAESKEKYHVDVSYRFAALVDLDAQGDINCAWDAIRETNKISTSDCLGCYELKKHKP